VASPVKPHSVNQILYFGTGTAVPIAHGKGFSINVSTQFADSTSWGDSFQTQKPGVIQATGQLMRHYVHADTNVRAAAMGRLVGKFYWYPDRTEPGDYVWWTGYLGGGGAAGGSLNEIIGETYDIVFDSQPVWVAT
jgi:hypothetical protein